MTVAHLAKRKVLAEVAAQGAAGEEDRSRPARPGDRRLLAHVEIRGGDADDLSDPADAALVCKAIDAAVSRTEPATFEHRVRLPDAAGEFA